MADQCIVCLENLDVEVADTPQFPSVSVTESTAGCAPAPPAGATPTAASGAVDTTAATQVNWKHSLRNDDNVAQIEVCGHILHNSCLREWTEKANSCPICRQAFHMVHVYDKIGGKLLESYAVQDKQQVAEFDPQAWLDENPEEEDATPCPVCNLADQEEVLLLCDGCDTPYHTHCIGLDRVPRGHWFCMECAETFGNDVAEPAEPPRARAGNSRSGARATSYFFPRTQASMRRARQRARSDEWQGAWGVISGRVWDALNLDLDYEDDDPGVFEGFRRSRQLREQERREHQRWQQRLNIASRLGARDVFENNIPVFQTRERDIPASHPPPQQSREERRAWGAFDRARESDTPNSRKRKSRSATAEPSEPQVPERKLKRPRTRRLPIHSSEASSSNAASAAAYQAERNAPAPVPNAGPSQPHMAAPSFLSSLLKEVEMGTPSDEESIRSAFGPIPGANDAPSPATSPSASGYNSPRASSITPPPNLNGRPASPTLTLSSHIEPIYPRANYSPSRSMSPRHSSPIEHRSPWSSPETSDSENHHRRSGDRRSGRSDIRQPRPVRTQALDLTRSKEVSPARSPLPFELKENISSIVRSALKPHWKSSHLTSEQYATINRDVSRKLYECVLDPNLVDDEARRQWESLATKEVAQAVAGLNG